MCRERSNRGCSAGGGREFWDVEIEEKRERADMRNKKSHFNALFHFSLNFHFTVCHLNAFV